MDYFIQVLGFLCAYLIGGIPTAYLFGRLIKGVDIRQFGSGNVGATNAFRVIGKWPGLLVLLIDIIKGYVCVTFVADIFMYASPVTRPELYRVIMGLFAILGHNWTVFLKFKGGKGVATSAGVAIGLIPKIFWLGFVVWGLVFFISGYVSIASIIAAISVPIFTLAFGQAPEVVIFMGLLALLIVYRHRSNIKRLINGEEKKITIFKKK